MTNMETEIVRNEEPKATAQSLSQEPFTVYIHVNAEGGIEINADAHANFYATIGAIEGARALMRCCVIDGYSASRKQKQQENANVKRTN